RRQRAGTCRFPSMSSHVNQWDINWLTGPQTSSTFWLSLALKQAALARIAGGPAHPGTCLAAGDDTDPAVMEFEVERGTGVDCRGGRDDPRGGVADHDVAAGEQTFVALRVGREPPGEIVERVVVAVEKSRHRVTQPRFDICDASAGAVEIGRQYRRP